MLHITFSEQDIADLRYERYHHPHPRVQMKMEALLLKSRGLPHHEIAACVGVSGPTLRAYFRTYLAGGIAALREVHFYQPTSDLEAHRTTLEAHFTAHPPANATQAAAMIEEVTGIKRSPTQIRIFMKKLGLKRLKTYAIPAKYNQEQQETFKKTTLSHDERKHRRSNAACILLMQHISYSIAILVFFGASRAYSCAHQAVGNDGTFWVR